MQKKYLITWSHYHGDPINHGLVSVDSKNYVNGEIPVEDYGMFYLRDTPFPTERPKIAQIFLDIMEEQAFGVEDTLPRSKEKIKDLLKNNNKRLQEFIYYGGELQQKVIDKINYDCPSFNKQKK